MHLEQQPKSSRALAPKLTCRLCRRQQTYQHYPCDCPQPAHRKCLTKLIQRKIQYQFPTGKITQGVNKSKILCPHCDKKIEFVCMCEKVEGGVGEWKHISRERKVSMVASLLIVLIIWGGFGLAIASLRQHISEVYSHRNLLIFLGLGLYGLFGVSICGWLGIGVFSRTRLRNLRIQIKK